MPPRNILFILTGSIACYKACDAISRLVQRGHRLRPVATAAALRFVGPATLEGLTGAPVGMDLFAAGAALDHIELARWADLTVVCPATANTINRMAAGLGDDLAGALLLAHEWRKPLLIAPAMNPAMWSHPATTAAVARLRGWGARFVAVGAGRTACGETGEGRLAEPDAIVAAIEAALAPPPAPRLRVLVTSGGTAEPIDGVRVITNTSTGETGARIAEAFAARGDEVLLLRARGACAAPPPVREELFSTFGELEAALNRLLASCDFDAVIHAAAVSDFAVESIEVDGVVHAPGRAKLPSDARPLLRLRHHPKLLDALRSRSRNAAVRIVGFKLTREADAAAVAGAVERLFARGAVDYVVHNDLAARAPGGFPADIWAPGRGIVEHCAGRDTIAPALIRLLAGSAEPAPPAAGGKSPAGDRPPAPA